jgi:hypothetical protein
VPPILREQLGIVGLLRSLAFDVTLSITSAEAATLSPEDLAALRELGATDALLEQLRTLAREGPEHVVFEVNFTQQTVTVSAGR